MTIAYDKDGNIIELYGITVKGGGGEGGVTDHAELTGRSKTNQHPISAIDGLQSSLDSINNKANAIGARTNVLEDTIIHKAVNVQLYYDGNHILDDKDGNILTYTDVYNTISEETNNVSVNYMDTNVLYPAFWTGDAVEFTNILMIDDKTYSTRLIINAENQISYDEEDLTSGGGDNANVDLSNLSHTGKSFASGLGMPSNTLIHYSLNDLTAGKEHSQVFTAPANGWARVSFYSSSVTKSDDYTVVTVKDSEQNETLLAQSFYAPRTGISMNCSLPISKGQKLNILYKISGLTESNYKVQFVYAQGEI